MGFIRGPEGVFQFCLEGKGGGDVGVEAPILESGTPQNAIQTPVRTLEH